MGNNALGRIMLCLVAKIKLIINRPKKFLRKLDIKYELQLKPDVFPI